MKKKTLPRFLVPDLDANRGEATLPPEEAQHLTRVLRAREGDSIAVFDGRGHEFVARVQSISRRRVSVSLVEPVVPPAESPVPITLAQGILKGEKMDDVVRDAVMLGAAGVVPLVTTHVAVSSAAIQSGRQIDRWRRVALASAKQCGRATLPPIEDPLPLAVVLASPQWTLKLLLVEPSAAGGAVSMRSIVDAPPPPSALLVVGPEGGWAEQERTAAISAGCILVTLGDLTLRADAVALAAISVLRVLWDTPDQR